MNNIERIYREVVDTFSEPENFPRCEVSEQAERFLKLIDMALAERADTAAEPDEETVERVAKGMFQSLRPIWGDDIPAEEIPEGDDPDLYYEYSISWEQWNKYGYGLDYDSLSEMRADDIRKLARAAIAAMPVCADADAGIQRDIATWARRTFGSTTDQVSQKLRAEYLELDQYLRDLSEAERDNSLVDDEQAHHDAVKEAADVLFMLFQLAENFGFDLLEETRKKFEVNKQRSWVKQADGTYQHKEATNG